MSNVPGTPGARRGEDGDECWGLWNPVGRGGGERLCGDEGCIEPTCVASASGVRLRRPDLAGRRLGCCTHWQQALLPVLLSGAPDAIRLAG